MSKSRLEWKVGLFVLISLALFAALVLKFSKGISAFTPTYILNLNAENVGGIIPGAVVLMAGVPIGNVTATEVDEDGRHVTIRVKLLKRYKIYGDAIFGIKQAGFLGDRFISVVPTENKGPLLKNGDRVTCEEPFDLQEVAKSTTGLIKRVDQTVQQLNLVVERIDRTLLAADTLTNLTASFINFRQLSDRTLSMVEHIDNFVKENTPPITGAVSNFGVVSLELNKTTTELRETVVTNRVQFTAAVNNFETASERVNHLLSDVEAGKGLAGNLLRNDELSLNVSLMVSNLAVLSSNLNNNGVWATLRKPKTPKKASSEKSTYQRP
jgi:phospholipid/cholesterol/gamma-HCH transport system substrate-binding protein